MLLQNGFDCVFNKSREAQGNIVKATSTTNTISSDVYPIRVKTEHDAATLTLVGGKNYVPIVFEGLTNVDNPRLWKSGGICGDWVEIDQSTHGKDFWQADYQAETELFEVTYNVLQDNAEDTTTTNYYYLGATPPSPTIIVQTQLNTEGWTINEAVVANLGNQVHFAPQVNDYGIVGFGDAGQWNWTGPNGFMATTRDILLPTVTANDIGIYTVTYTTPYGCNINQTFELSCIDENEDGNCDSAEGLCDGFVQTAFNLTTNHQQNADFKTISTIESTATIAAGLTVNYLAGQQIILKPGFYAPASSTFSALIDDCSTGLFVEAASNRNDGNNKITLKNQLKEVHIFPNPFKKTVTINYTLTEGTPLEISIYDFTGRQIATIINTDYQAAGHFMVQWRRPNISAQGIFLLAIKTNKTIITRKMIVHN
ncbi:MAG: 3-coathanger stack domain-containing protein [Saprospiraceae bacterium]